jgi:hypothetical protein
VQRAGLELALLDALRQLEQLPRQRHARCVVGDRGEE